MGRVAVRAAVTAYLTNADLPYVGTVYSSRPTRVQGDDYTRDMQGNVVTSANGSAAVLVVNLPSDDRERIAETGRGAVDDMEKLTVTLEIFFISSKGDAIAAVNDYDQLVDALITAIRSDATLGAPTVIWSAGEYPTPSIRHRQDEPRPTGKGLQMFIGGIVEFEAWQNIVGPVSTL